MAAQYKNPKILEKVRDALRVTGGHKTEAAKLLGMSRGNFYRALEVLGWNVGDVNKGLEGNVESVSVGTTTEGEK